QFVVCVERSLAETGEVLAAAENAGIGESAQELTRIAGHLRRVVRDCPRTQHCPGGLESQVEHGSEVHIEAQRAAVFADDASMLAKERAAACGENVCRRGSRTH